MGGRNTIQRDLVYTTVLQMEHPTAEEVYAQISQVHPSVSKGTVYRNLNVLVERGSLKKVNIPEGADRFDFTLADHYHVRCRNCGLVADIEMPYLDNLESQLTDSCGFLVEGHDIMFRGVCPRCRKAQSDNRS